MTWLPLYSPTPEVDAEGNKHVCLKWIEVIFSLGFQAFAIVCFWVGYARLTLPTEEGGYGPLSTLTVGGGLTGGALCLAYLLILLISFCGMLSSNASNNRGLGILVMPLYALILGLLFSALAGTTALWSLTFKYSESEMALAMPKHTWIALSGVCQSVALAAFLACSALLISKAGFNPAELSTAASAGQTVPLNPNVRINLATRRIGV